MGPVQLPHGSASLPWRIAKTVAAGAAAAGLTIAGGTIVRSLQPDPSDTRKPPPPLRDAIKGASYTNPVYRGSAPDPSVIRAPGGFYAYTTTPENRSEPFRHVPLLSSSDLATWKRSGDALPKLPSWARGPVWAPHVVEMRGKYHMYFSARVKGTNDFAVGLAVAEHASGPFVPTDKPVLRGVKNYSIDPFVHVDERTGTGTLYVGSGKQPIVSFELNAAGTEALRPERGGDVQLRPSSRDYEELIEAPWITRHAGHYYMFYSGDGFREHYAVRVARSNSPHGPWQKQSGAPLLEGNRALREPGHNSVIADDAGQHWMVYHAFESGRRDEGRKLLLDRVAWTKDGWPRMTGGRGPTDTPRPAPVVK